MAVDILDPFESDKSDTVEIPRGYGVSRSFFVPCSTLPTLDTPASVLHSDI